MKIPMIEFETTIDELVNKAAKENCEITITVAPDNVEIRVSPWKPFGYSSQSFPLNYNKQNKKETDDETDS